ncbi:MAG: hypothetical protein PHP45_09750 [Elusimicrobiales bacterium]|nr:hypothetical protein [Elusimicrobiales bacterium]
MNLHLFLLCLLLAFGLLSVMARSLLLAGISLAAASVSLTLVLFEMNAPWAGVFELSVCAGLITVLFVSTVSVVRREEQFIAENRLRFYSLPFFLAVFGMAFWLFAEPLTRALVPAVPPQVQINVGTTLWQLRWGDLLGQLCVFVAGALAINAFFRNKNNA